MKLDPRGSTVLGQDACRDRLSRVPAHRRESGESRSMGLTRLMSFR